MTGEIIVQPELSLLETEHYSRHLKLPGFGLEKQLMLKNAKVLLVGAGGLGCPVGLYLAAAGVGTLGVVDFDRVERSNLQRQIAHRVDQLGQPKVDSLIQAMKGINPNLTYISHNVHLTETNVLDLIADYELIIDGSDNYTTRFLLADASYLSRKALLHGAVYQYDAQISLFIPGETACYRCVFREPPKNGALASCAEVGVLGVMPGTIGLMMATEAIKTLTGLTTPTKGKLLLYNALEQTIRHLALQPDADCPLCGPNATIHEVEAVNITCSMREESNGWSLDYHQAQEFLQQERAILLDVREIFEFQAGHLPQAKHLPLSQLPHQVQAVIPDLDCPILAYCQRGQRSLEAVRQLRALGYASSYSLSNGISSWKEWESEAFNALV